MRTWAACGPVIASSRSFRVPRTAESKDESARLKSSRQALWMMVVTESRSWERDQSREDGCGRWRPTSSYDSTERPRCSWPVSPSSSTSFGDESTDASRSL
jgi:hypothetical protein